MWYRVEVTVGDFLTGSVNVEADSPEDARAEAEEVIRSASVEATRVWEHDDSGSGFKRTDR